MDSELNESQLKEKENIDVPTKEEYRKEIETEIMEGREVYALFLTHGHIETFLREILCLLGGRVGKTDGLSNTMIKKIERIPFETIVLLHTTLSVIDKKLYSEICELNAFRNKLAHDLAKYELTDKDNKETIKQYVEFGLASCDCVYDIYINELSNLRAEHDFDQMKDN